MGERRESKSTHEPSRSFQGAHDRSTDLLLTPLSGLKCVRVRGGPSTMDVGSDTTTRNGVRNPVSTHSFHPSFPRPIYPTSFGSTKPKFRSQVIQVFVDTDTVRTPASTESRTETKGPTPFSSLLYLSFLRGLTVLFPSRGRYFSLPDRILFKYDTQVGVWTQQTLIFWTKGRVLCVSEQVQLRERRGERTGVEVSNSMGN